MNEKLPEQDKESGGAATPDPSMEGLPIKTEESEGTPQARETTPLDENEARADNASQRERVLEDIKASISQTGEKATSNVSAATSAKTLQPPAGEKKEEDNTMGGGGKLGRGFGKGLKFLGKLLGFGFVVMFGSIGALMGGLFKMGSGKGGGKDSGHKKEPKKESSKSHAAPKGGGGGGHGGHAPKESHGGAHHH